MMSNTKTRRNIFLTVVALFLTAYGKDWQPDVDRGDEEAQDALKRLGAE